MKSKEDRGRALMPASKRTPSARAARDADLLFDLMQSGDAEVVYEVGCVLDEALEPVHTVYTHRDIFAAVYAVHARRLDGLVRHILRHLKRGTPPTEIARKLKEGGTRR